MRSIVKFKRQLNILILLCLMTVLLVTVSQNNIENIEIHSTINSIFSNNVTRPKQKLGKHENETVKITKNSTLKFVNLWRPVLFNSNETEIKDDRILKQRKWIKEIVTDTDLFQTIKPKKILVLNGFYSYFGNKGKLNCASPLFESKCSLTQDHWYTGFFHNFENYDAVVTISNWVYKIYESRIPTARQIIFTVESPYVTRYADLSVNNAILASYWRGSDITIPYGKWASHNQLDQKSTTSNFNTTRQNYATGKKKLVAIVVSDCAPENRRLDYVKTLQKYITVDIYGKCGTLKCGKDCFKKLQQDYKFYLAFERANCRDYITEKFFHNALQHDMVPITLGAHKEDYIHAAPPNSFIHVEDFKTPWHLASYLMHLDQNDSEYNTYFDWKTRGKFIDSSQDLFCRVCGLLIYEQFIPAPVWPTGSTWKKVNKCLPKGKLYWDRTN